MENYKFGKLDILRDSRINCVSAMTSITIREYIELVESAYKQRGGIIGQREKLKTTSAIRIRKRMVFDIHQGAVLPPIVLGLVLDREQFKAFSGKTTTLQQRKNILSNDHQDRLSIIDGMQRTTAILEAFDKNIPAPDRMVRVEFWVAEDVGSLIYRMLVLNTGQVPWNLRRQVEVVFRSLVLDLKISVDGLIVLSNDENGRRTRGGQLQADELIELYLVFGARKEKIDIRERLADEFTRLDFMEVAENVNFSNYFKNALKGLIDLDISFDKKKAHRGAEGRFVAGKDIFSSQPACVGFVTAIALEVFGRPGVSRGEDEQKKKMEEVVRKIARLCKKIDVLDKLGLDDFLCLQTLNESLPKTKVHGSIGDSEREYFLKAFQVMLDEKGDLESLEPCWRAY